MASLIPTYNSCAPRMTGGERRLAQRLQQKLEDDYQLWYDVPIGLKQRHPDFVILHPRRGLLVLEVKDWKTDTIHSADKTLFQIRTPRRVVKAVNPLLQARACALEITVVLERDPTLLQPEGSRHAGKLVMPWAYGVVLTNINRKQFEAGGLADILPEHLVICQDEMFERVDAEGFQERLWAMFPQVFPVALTLPQLDRIRWHIFPELRVEPGNGQFGLFEDFDTKDARAANIPDLIKVMDRQQESLARSLGSEHRIIHGVAGSGKTMILGFRATYLAQALSKPILVLCYNRTLAARLEQLMASRKLTGRVQVYNFHSWCYHMLKSYQAPLPKQGSNDFFEQMVERVMEGVDREQIPRFQYGAVLVDEGHDFEPDWYKLIVQMVDPNTNSLLILYDDAQNIYGSTKRPKTSWKTLGVQAQGRTTILRLNYRNTLEILSLAQSFAHELLTERQASDDDIPLVAPESAGRRGPIPELARASNVWKEKEMLVTALREEHEHGRAWQDMAIIYRNHWEGHEIAKALKGSGLPYTEATAKGKRDLYANGDTIKLMTMHSSKGLEFAFVAIPYLGTMPRPDEEESDEARLLYVAMTRASDQLLMTYHKESAFTRRIRASIHDVQGQFAPTPVS